MGFLHSLDRRFLLLLMALFFVYVAVIFIIIGLCTNNWIELRNRNLYREEIAVHFGLHRVCWDNSEHCNNAGNDYDRQNILPAVQGLVITGGFVTVIAALMTLANMFLDRLGQSSGVFSGIIAAVSSLAGTLVLVGAILFAVKVEIRSEYLVIGYTEFQGFSFGLPTCAAIMMYVAAILSGCSGLSPASPKFANQVPGGSMVIYQFTRVPNPS